MNDLMIPEGFTDEDVKQRPFAIETGYSEWTDMACNLLVRSEVALGLLGDSLETRERVEEALPRGMVLAMDACRATCERGYYSRDREEITIPSPYLLTKGALGDEYMRFLNDTLLYIDSEETLEGETEEDFEARLKLASLVPIVAEGAYLWGRHGDQIDFPESLPAVVEGSGLVTVRPHAKQPEEEVPSVRSVYEAAKEFKPYEPSFFERVRARLSGKAWEDLQVKEGIKNYDLLNKLTNDAIQVALGSSSIEVSN